MDSTIARAVRLNLAMTAILMPNSSKRLAFLVDALRNHIGDNTIEDADIAVRLMSEITDYAPFITNYTVINVVSEIASYYSTFDTISAITDSDATVQEVVTAASGAKTYLGARLTWLAARSIEDVL